MKCIDKANKVNADGTIGLSIENPMTFDVSGISQLYVQYFCRDQVFEKKHKILPYR